MVAFFARFNQLIEQSLSLYEIHYIIYGSMLAEKIIHAHNGRHVPQARHDLRFFQKALFAPFKILFILSRQRSNGIPHAGRSIHGVLGIVFLDSNLDEQIQVIAHVSDAKSALSQHAANLVFSIQNRIRQLIWLVLMCLIKTAMRTDFRPRFNRFHTAHTAFRQHHTSHLLSLDMALLMFSIIQRISIFCHIFV